jgi:hypothetical protein
VAGHVRGAQLSVHLPRRLRQRGAILQPRLQVGQDRRPTGSGGLVVVDAREILVGEGEADHVAVRVDGEGGLRGATERDDEPAGRIGLEHLADDVGDAGAITGPFRGGWTVSRGPIDAVIADLRAGFFTRS